MKVSICAKDDKESKAIIGMLSFVLSKKLGSKIMIIDKDGYIYLYDKGRKDLIFSNEKELFDESLYVFDFKEKGSNRNKITIIDDSISDYERIIDSKTSMKKIIIKNYIPIYKDIRTILGPNLIKGHYKNSIKINVIEYDIRFKNHVYLYSFNEPGFEKDFIIENPKFENKLLEIYKKMIRRGEKIDRKICN